MVCYRHTDAATFAHPRQLLPAGAQNPLVLPQGICQIGMANYCFDFKGFFVGPRILEEVLGREIPTEGATGT